MDVFSALAEPTRRSILEMLASRGPLSATEIYEQFPVSPPAISQHLKVLREARLVLMEKRAQQHIYQINPETLFELEAWARQMMRLWNQRFDALDQVLEVEKMKIQAEQNKKVENIENLKETELTFTRIFDAPRELVFKAFSEAEQIRQWWPPQGWTMPVCRLDFRPGGEWIYNFRNSDGEEHWSKAVYDEIVPVEKIVYTDWFIDAQGNVIQGLPSKQVTMTFDDLDGKTQLNVHVQLKSAADRKKLVEMGFMQGFTQTLNNLEQHLRSEKQ